MRLRIRHQNQTGPAPPASHRALCEAINWLTVRTQVTCLAPMILAGLLVVTADAAPSSPTPTNDVELTAAAQVVSLSPIEAATRKKVRLRGMITLNKPNWRMLYIQDLTSGVYLLPSGDYPNYEAGIRIEVEGTTRDGFTPFVAVSRITKIPPSQVHSITPKARPVSLEFLQTGKADCQWIEVEASVHQARYQDQHVVLELGATPRPVTASIPAPVEPTNLTSLVRATIWVRGVCNVDSDSDREIRRILVLASYPSEYRILTPAPPGDAFDVPLLTLTNALYLARTNKIEPWVRVKGLVTADFGNGKWCLDDGQRGTELWSEPTADLKAGDEIEAAGFLATDGLNRVLEDTVFRRLSRERPISPTVIQLGMTNHDAMCSRLVTLTAPLLEYSRQSDHETLTVGKLPHLVVAELANTNRASALISVPVNSVLQLTGVWLGPENPTPGSNPRLLLRSSADIRVLRLPSWWTPVRISIVLGTLMGICLLVLAWAVTLRHQVQRQTDQMRARLENEMLLEKRFQDLVENASDMICTLDKQGCFLTLNAAGERILGYPRDHFIGRKLSDWVTADSQADLRLALGDSVQANGGTVHELDVAAKDGSRRILEVSTRPLADERQTGGLQMIARDVTERQKTADELEALQRQLVEQSRKAGMAEVATGVLHNIGNVLNSVNVSCTVAMDSLRQSNIGNLTKISAMMEEHKHNLGEFLTTDPKGSKILEYLSSLAKVLTEEQHSTLKELHALREQIDHIKSIVVMQQSYGKSSGFMETVRITQLFEDALKLAVNPLARHHIQVVRQFEELPPASQNKHKVLQILLNLLRNAKQALDAGGGENKKLILQIKRVPPDRLCLQVIDNGIGIDSGQLARIFDHGFTTRADGHGFGLHTCALYAKELGGSLTASSNGRGQGATFTLELPFQPVPNS
jgi:PAS domain S-box-containing protein